jgi:hypothetical protein
MRERRCDALVETDECGRAIVLLAGQNTRLETVDNTLADLGGLRFGFDPGFARCEAGRNVLGDRTFDCGFGPIRRHQQLPQLWTAIRDDQQSECGKMLGLKRPAAPIRQPS